MESVWGDERQGLGGGARPSAPRARILHLDRAPPGRTAEACFEAGCTLEERFPLRAREAYRRAIELEPTHARAHLNLGRLEHQAGDVAAAEARYRTALALAPADPLAWFNLGVALEDRGRTVEAIRSYRASLERDADLADARWNLARLYESIGESARALAELSAYARLTRARA